jgi:hypothetical protein
MDILDKVRREGIANWIQAGGDNALLQHQTVD